MNRCIGLLVIGAALWVGGCATSAPRATVTGVALTDASDHGGRVEVTVALSNPNDVALPLSQLTYQVTANGARPFTYTGPSGVSLPAHGTQTVQLPAGLRSADSLQGRSVNVSGRIGYRPPGELNSLLYESGVPLPSFGFEASGKLK